MLHIEPSVTKLRSTLVGSGKLLYINVFEMACLVIYFIRQCKCKYDSNYHFIICTEVKTYIDAFFVSSRAFILRLVSSMVARLVGYSI
jgi:hypothetical protein